MGRYENGSKEKYNTNAEQTEHRQYNPTQLFFFQRLERLLRLQDEYEALLRPDDWETTLLHKAIYSTYCDCVQLGVGGEAKARLAKKRSLPGLAEGN